MHVRTLVSRASGGPPLTSGRLPHFFAALARASTSPPQISWFYPISDPPSDIDADKSHLFTALRASPKVASPPEPAGPAFPLARSDFADYRLALSFSDIAWASPQRPAGHGQMYLTVDHVKIIISVKGSIFPPQLHSLSFHVAQFSV